MSFGAGLYASYLVRIWQRRDRAGGPVETWLADVEHIQTGVRHRFDRADELWDFLRRDVMEGAVEYDEAVFVDVDVEAGAEVGLDE